MQQSTSRVIFLWQYLFEQPFNSHLHILSKSYYLYLAIEGNGNVFKLANHETLFSINFVKSQHKLDSTNIRPSIVKITMYTVFSRMAIILTACEVTHKSFLKNNSVYRQYSNVTHDNILISLVLWTPASAAFIYLSLSCCYYCSWGKVSSPVAFLFKSFFVVD